MHPMMVADSMVGSYETIKNQQIRSSSTIFLVFIHVQVILSPKTGYNFKAGNDLSPLFKAFLTCLYCHVIGYI